MSLTVFFLIYFFNLKVKGVGGWIHELFCAPFGKNPLLFDTYLEGAIEVDTAPVDKLF